MLLAEYVLATGDRSCMPDLKRITMEIVRGQSEVGSWGHRFVQANGRLAGYGMMNAPGLPLTVSLILAREAGVDDPELDEAIGDLGAVAKDLRETTRIINERLPRVMDDISATLESVDEAGRTELLAEC